MPRNNVLAGDKLAFHVHISELKRRLFWFGCVFLLFSFVSYFFKDFLEQIIIRPLNQELIYTSPTGGIEFVFKLCLFVGLTASFPVLLFNILQFIRPAFPKRIIVKVGSVVAVSYMLLILGVTLAYFFSLPATLHFLAQFSSGNITALITVQEYSSFVLIYLAGFGIIFQLPLILLLINSFSPVSIKTLLKYLPQVVIGSFIIAAIITPTPDPINQTVMAMPIIVLYLLSVPLIYLINQRRN